MTGMASIDSSAPETTSSDNSPTMVRRSWSLNGGATKHQGPGSDSGSSGKSSDSLGSSSSGEKRAAGKARDTDRLVLTLAFCSYSFRKLCLVFKGHLLQKNNNYENMHVHMYYAI